MIHQSPVVLSGDDERYVFGNIDFDASAFPGQWLILLPIGVTSSFQPIEMNNLSPFARRYSVYNPSPCIRLSRIVKSELPSRPC